MDEAKRISLPGAALAGAIAVAAGLLTSGAETLFLLVLLGAAVASFFGVLARPAIGLGVIVLAIFVNLSDVLIEFHGVPSVAKAYLPVLLALIAFEWFTGRRRMYLSPAAAVVVVVYALILSMSWYYASDPARVTAAYSAFLKNVALALAIAVLAARPDHFRAAIWGILLGALFLGSLSVIKALTGSASDFAGFAQSAVPYVHDEGTSSRFSGPLHDPNFYAQFMLIGAAVAFERAMSERHPALRGLAVAALAVALAAVVLTYSRGALIALAIMLPFALYCLRNQRRFLLVAVLAGVAVLPVLPAGYVERALAAVPLLGITVDGMQSPDVSIRGRMGEMMVAWQMFLDHPLWGVGYNNYEEYFQQYSLALDQIPRGEGRPAHSLYLEIASERGLVGILSFLALLTYLGYAMTNGWRSLQRAGDTDTARMVAGLGVGMLGYLAAATFLHDAYPRFMWLVFGLALAVPGLLRQADRDGAGGAQS